MKWLSAYFEHLFRHLFRPHTTSDSPLLARLASMMVGSTKSGKEEIVFSERQARVKLEQLLGPEFYPFYGSLVSVEKVAKHVTYTTHAVVCSRIPAVHTYAANNAVKHAIRTFHASRLDTGASNAV